MKNLIDSLYKVLCKETINAVTETIDDIIAAGLQNEQWFLDFLDELNKQSVRC